MKRKIALVVQRYGEDILGGAESHARQVAERLAAHYEVEVLTTCARDYETWQNEYPAGITQSNGVRIRRFEVARPRAADFSESSRRIFNRPHTFEDEWAWIEDQGPYCPDLLAYLHHERDAHDVFAFFTYLYYPTAMGIHLVDDKALLVPTAHDEYPFSFEYYRTVFRAPRGILYNTEEERQFVQSRFGRDLMPTAIAGVGVDLPTAGPGRFRRSLGLGEQPYFLYLGRITTSKGCDELLRFYECYGAAYPDEASLVIVGTGEMPLPDQPGVVYAGFLEDKAKADALAGAVAVIVPSRFESMSMVALEAWTLGKPVVCTSHSPVVRSMCQRSHGGLDYADGTEFSEILHRLVTDVRLNSILGQQGQMFVASTYTWPRVIAIYQEFIEMVGGNRSRVDGTVTGEVMHQLEAVVLPSCLTQPEDPSRWCKLCDLPDWEDDDLLSMLNELKLGSSGPERFHRKRWEYAHLLRGLQFFDCLRPDAVALGVGAGREHVLYYLANRIGKVVAADIYGEGEFHSQEAPAEMLVYPERFAPFPYREGHLWPQFMNGCELRYAADSFDFVFSLSSIEHFGGHEAATRSVQEMARVLRPGGVAVIATEAILNGVAHPEYFLPEELYACLVRPVGLDLLEPIDFRITPSLLQNPVDLTRDSSGIFPHVVCRLNDVIFTSVFLWLRKPSRSSEARVTSP